MSRPRTIDQSQILDAAEAVVARDGAARLTLDAVAIAAGISKASVIYDYKSKQALIRAVIERRVSEEQEKLRLATEKLGTGTDVHLRARINVISDNARDLPEAVAFNLLSAMAQDADLRSLMNDTYRAELEAILESSTNKRAAIIAFLALEGVRCLEVLGFVRWPDDKRAEIMRDIEGLISEKIPVRPPRDLSPVPVKN